MKIIDILNKIANGEEVPKKISYMGTEYTYDDEILDYYDDNEKLLFDTHNNFLLNEEVEIIGEDKKIEKLDFSECLVCPDLESLKEYVNKHNHIMRTKINEIIDYINMEK